MINLFKRRVPKKYVTLAERRRRRELEEKIIYTLGSIFIVAIIIGNCSYGFLVFISLFIFLISFL